MAFDAPVIVGEWDITIREATATPLPAALPLFATGLGALGLLGWRRKRKAQAAPNQNTVGFRRGRREAVFLIAQAGLLMSAIGTKRK